MTTRAPQLIEDANLSYAWGEAFLLALHLPATNPPPLVVSVTRFPDGLAAEDGAIREALDAELKTRTNSGIEVSAMVVFPYRQWLSRGSPPYAEFRQWCIKRFIPRLKARCPRNRRGVYFERMMDFRGGLPNNAEGKDQLQHIIAWWKERRGKGRRPPRSRLQMACFDPLRDHNHQARPEFPCLQQVGFSYDDDGLAVNAFYPTQYLFDRAYGNYLGLCRLGHFVAQELELRLVRFNCYVGRAELGNATKRSLTHLADQVCHVLAGAGRRVNV